MEQSNTSTQGAIPSTSSIYSRNLNKELQYKLGVPTKAAALYKIVLLCAQRLSESLCHQVGGPKMKWWTPVLRIGTRIDPATKEKHA
jgi:hypothetical protein